MIYIILYLIDVTDNLGKARGNCVKNTVRCTVVSVRHSPLNILRLNEKIENKQCLKMQNRFNILYSIKHRFYFFIDLIRINQQIEMSSEIVLLRNKKWDHLKGFFNKILK